MHAATTPPAWRTESNTTTQTLAAVAALITGVAMSALAWDVDGHSIGVLCARALGAALTFVGLALIAWGGRQVVDVDPYRRCIRLESRSRFHSNQREILFDDIADVSVGELGDREGGTPSYHLVVTLHDQTEVAVFAGFFDGRYSRAEMEARRLRLLQWIQRTV